MAAEKGLTRFGIGVEFSDTTEGEKVSKTYNGFDMSNDDGDQAMLTTLFVRGGGSAPGGTPYVGLAGLLTENFIINNIDIIARNQVTGTY